MEKPSQTDIRVMANKVAQKILKGNVLQQVDGDMPPGKFFHEFSEHEITNMAAEALKEYFNV